MDPWYPLGSGDMLEVAGMAIHAVPMTSRAAMRGAFDMVTTAAARAIGLQDYGLSSGAHADFVILQAADPIEAIRLRATRLAVVRRGMVVARAAPRRSDLDLPGRPTMVDPAAYAAPVCA